MRDLYPVIVLQRTLLVGALAVFVLIALSSAAFAIAGQPSGDHVAPAVDLAGTDLSGMSTEAARSAVAVLAASYETATFTAGSEGRTFNAPTSSIGLRVNQEATLQAALDIGRKGSYFSRTLDWISAVAGKRSVPVITSVDMAALSQTVSKLDPGPRVEPVEPTFEMEGDVIQVNPASAGQGIDPGAVLQTIGPAAKSGLPLEFDAAPGRIEPRFSTEKASELARTVNDRIRDPLRIQAGRASTNASITVQRSWIDADSSGDVLRAVPNKTRVSKSLSELFPNAGVKPVEASYTIENDVPRFVEGRPGTTCCSDDAVQKVVDRVTQIAEDKPVTPLPTLALREVRPKLTKKDEPALGVTQLVAEFTTNHPPGQPRVTNIHRIADLVRGQVIRPGETFSLNDFVGPRTLEKGFVVDHVIVDAKFSEAVGGGISQFATTLFNASFFAGLDYGEYMAHTIYIDRYPYGREATISYPHPDLQIKNTTPYGVVIWPTYTDSSIRVALYSTKYVNVEQTNQVKSTRGECTAVKTDRTRRYLDGRSAVDSVRALYQPAEGVKC